MKESTSIAFVGLVGIVTPIFGLSAMFASTLLCGVGCGEGTPISPPFSAWNEWESDESFSWSSNALSDLGVSQVANVYNCSLILVGILNLIFAIGFVRVYAKSALFYLGGILLILGGGSLSLVGVFTQAYGFLHLYVSLGYFVLFPMAMILVGLAFIRMNMQTKGYLSILAGIIALLVILSALTLQWHTLLGLGFAVPEIVEAVVIAVWIVWMGVSLVCVASEKRFQELKRLAVQKRVNRVRARAKTLKTMIRVTVH